MAALLVVDDVPRRRGVTKLNATPRALHHHIPDGSAAILCVSSARGLAGGRHPLGDTHGHGGKCARPTTATADSRQPSDASHRRWAGETWWERYGWPSPPKDGATSTKRRMAGGDKAACHTGRTGLLRHTGRRTRPGLDAGRNHIEPFGWRRGPTVRCGGQLATGSHLTRKRPKEASQTGRPGTRADDRPSVVGDGGIREVHPED